MATDRMILLAEEIGALQERLQQRRAELQSLQQSGGMQPVPQPQPKKATGRAGRPAGILVPGSAASKVVDLLAKSPRKTFTPAAIAKEAGLELLAVRGVLVRLSATKRIVRAGRGKYRAAS